MGLFLAACLLAAPFPLRSQTETPSALVAAARSVSREIAVVRELAWHRPVDFEVRSRTEIRRYAEGALEKEMTPELWSAYGELLAHCGLVPRGTDLKDLVVGLYAEQVAGYYDPQEKTFYLADWLPRLLQKAVVAHEATHALQDQHFDLVEWLGDVSSTDDAGLARAAVVEGDAMAAMLAYFLAPLGTPLAELPDVAGLLEGRSAEIASTYPTFDRAPRALQRLLLFPYVEGTGFVMTALREGGWEAVDGLYRDPPRSTEQILHPERYWQTRDAPRAPELPSAYGEPAIEGSWGEFGTRLILAAALGDSAAAPAARGWDGDRYALYERPGGGSGYAWTLVWDTADDAERFAAAYAQAIAARFPGSARIETGSGRFYFDGQGRELELVWSGDQVRIRENL